MAEVSQMGQDNGICGRWGRARVRWLGEAGVGLGWRGQEGRVTARGLGEAEIGLRWQQSLPDRFHVGSLFIEHTDFLSSTVSLTHSAW